MTAARRIDEIVGVTTAGKWDDEEVIQGVLEPLGEAASLGEVVVVSARMVGLDIGTRRLRRPSVELHPTMHPDHHVSLLGPASATISNVQQLP